MKRFGNLYCQIYSLENLRLAHQNAKKGKLHYSEVKIVDSDPEKYLTEIHEMLKNKTYRTSEYKIFTKFDGKKEREIYVLPYYPDRIIQWAIMQVLEPIWVGSFVAQTYSSIKARGIHQCLKHLSRDLHRDPAGTKYCLKIDIKKFYPSIDHKILKKTLRYKIKDPDLLTMLDEIIDSSPGVPIGNYLSQYLGNIYLNTFDHWIKEEKNIHYFYRYCDDVVILASSKTFLKELLYEISGYLKLNLNLEINPRYQIFPTRLRGIDFVGYRFFGDYILLRKSILKRMKQKLIPLAKFCEVTKHDLNVVASYNGWLMWCNGYRLMNKYLSPLKEKDVVL